MMRTISIIGHNGYIGSNLKAKAEASGFQILEIKKNEIPSTNLGVVYYCAGKTSDFLKNPSETIDSHVTYFSQILDQATFEKIVYLSSSRVYDYSADETATTHGKYLLSPETPRNLFDLTKLTGEWLAINHPKAIIARTANVFGGNGKGTTFLQNLINEIKSGKKEIAFNSSPLVNRYYISMNQLTDSLLKIPYRDDHRKIFDISYDEPISNKEIISTFEDAGIKVTLNSSGNTIDQRLINPDIKDYIFQKNDFFVELQHSLSMDSK